jgi:hypothetical protein
MSEPMKVVSTQYGDIKFWEKKQITTTNTAGIFTSLEGRILTIIDACMVESEQKKAIKDLIKREIWSTQDKIVNWAASQNEESQSSFPYRFEISGTK